MQWPNWPGNHVTFGKPPNMISLIRAPDLLASNKPYRIESMMEVLTAPAQSTPPLHADDDPQFIGKIHNSTRLS